VHLQNKDTWEAYSEGIRNGELPLSRAYRPSPEERLIRELVLQFKLGRLRPPYFAEKYGVNILKRFEAPFASLAQDRYLAEANDQIVSLTREGLMRVDTLLSRFFLPQHAGIRYT